MLHGFQQLVTSSRHVKVSSGKRQLLQNCVHALLQSCPTLCDSMHCSLPGSSVHGISQARILEWVAMSFSRGISLTQGSNMGLLHCRWIFFIAEPLEKPSSEILVDIKWRERCEHDGRDSLLCVRVFSLQQGRYFPHGSAVENLPAMQETCRRCRFDPWVGKIPWRRKWQPPLVFLPGKSQGQKSLVGYSA